MDFEKLFNEFVGGYYDPNEKKRDLYDDPWAAVGRVRNRADRREACRTLPPSHIKLRARAYA